MHVHQELHQLLARNLLRAIRQIVKLRNQLAELIYLFAKLAAVSHTPPFELKLAVSPKFKRDVRLHKPLGLTFKKPAMHSSA